MSLNTIPNTILQALNHLKDNKPLPEGLQHRSHIGKIDGLLRVWGWEPTLTGTPTRTCLKGYYVVEGVHRPLTELEFKEMFDE